MTAVIFDLDGTLIDSAPDIQFAVNAMLADAGHAPLDLKTVTSFIGNGVPTLVQRVMDHLSIQSEHHGDLVTSMMHHYTASKNTHTKFYPEVEPLLHALKSQGIKLGICTNKPYEPAYDVLKHFGILTLFDTIIGGDSLPTRKPDPAMLLTAAASLDDPNTLYVGDSEVDYHTAQNANLPFALFTGGYRKNPIDYFTDCAQFDDFTQLPKIISSFSKYPG